MIDNLEKRKKELIEQSKQGINAKVAEYKALLSKAAEGQNQAAAMDYAKMPQDNLTRSAYLNRLQRPDYDAISAAGSYYDKLTDTSDYAALRQKDLINKEKMAYQDERNAEAQRRYEAELSEAQRRYEAELSARQNRSYSGGSSGGSSGEVYEVYDAPANPYAKYTQQGIEPLYQIVQIAAGGNVDKATARRLIQLAKKNGADSSVIEKLNELLRR